jgi:transcriptional regulator with XRE-family HTH domain
VSVADSELGLNWRAIVCANMRRRRLALGFSQEKVGESVGIKMSHDGMIERGPHNISLSTLVRIAAALSVHPSELFAHHERSTCS